jgi:hypothetical protein
MFAVDKRRSVAWGLFGKHIHRGSRDATSIEGFDKCLFIDQASPRCIYDDGATLHLSYVVSVDDMLGSGSKGCIER